MTVSKEFRFEASHVLPKHPGKCSRLHGHSWVGWLTVEGPVNEATGFVIDYADLKTLIDKHIVGLLDHQHLGQGTMTTRIEQVEIYRPAFGEHFYPSSENLVLAIAKIIKPFIPEIEPNARLVEVSLNETCTSRATINVDTDPRLSWTPPANS